MKVVPNRIIDKSVRKGIIILRGIPQRRSTIFVTLLLKTMNPNMKQHIETMKSIRDIQFVNLSFDCKDSIFMRKSRMLLCKNKMKAFDFVDIVLN